MCRNQIYEFSPNESVQFHAHIKCEQCDFVAENKSNLNDHIKSVHPKPKKPRTKKKPKEEQASTMDTMQSGTLEPVFAPHSVVPNSIEEDGRKVIVQPAASPVGTVLMSPLEDTPEKVPLSHAISNMDTIDNSQLQRLRGKSESPGQCGERNSRAGGHPGSSHQQVHTEVTND